MKQLLIIILICFPVSGLLAQSVEVDKKSGLVKVNGKDSFYVKKKGGNFSVYNKNQAELIYVTFEDVPGQTGSTPRFTFIKTGNSCLVFEFGFALNWYKVVRVSH